MSSDLARRIVFTIGALLVFRLGTYIPIPGIDPLALGALFRAQTNDVLGLANAFSGGGVRRMGIFALTLTPYLAAAILLQLVSLGVPALRELPRRGEAGRRRLDAYVMAVTIGFAVFQSLGVATALENVSSVVANPVGSFRLTSVATLTGGTVFLVWLSRQITARGVGNGLALILFVGIVVELPVQVAEALELGRQGIVSTGAILVGAVLAIALTAFVVVMESAQRRLPILYQRRQVGLRMIEGRSDLVFKLNSAGVIPVLLASWIMLLPMWIASVADPQEPGLMGAIVSGLERGRPLYVALYALAIVFCTFFYTAFLLDPEQAAEDLIKRGGAVAGVDPGYATAEHLDSVMSRTTGLGALYLAAVCLLPEILIAHAQVPFYLGGPSLLVVVCVILDLGAHCQAVALGKGSD